MIDQKQAVRIAQDWLDSNEPGATAELTDAGPRAFDWVTLELDVFGVRQGHLRACSRGLREHLRKELLDESSIILVHTHSTASPSAAQVPWFKDLYSPTAHQNAISASGRYSIQLNASEIECGFGSLASGVTSLAAESVQLVRLYSSALWSWVPLSPPESVAETESGWFDPDSFDLNRAA